MSEVSEGAPEDYSLVFGWPLEQAATRSAFVGEGAGMLEVVEIPAALRGTVAPGVRLLAVANRDVAATADAAQRCGVRRPRAAHGHERGGARRDDRRGGRGRGPVRADPVRLSQLGRASAARSSASRCSSDHGSPARPLLMPTASAPASRQRANRTGSRSA